MRFITCILSLLFLGVASACHGQETIDIINNSTNFVVVYRLGNPNFTLQIQRRWNQRVTLPMVSGASDNMQMIELQREGSVNATPETSFSGFNGSFAQSCTLIVDPGAISIRYNAIPASNASPTNTTASTNRSASTPARAGTSAGGGTAGSGNGSNGAGYGYGSPNKTGATNHTTTPSPVFGEDQLDPQGRGKTPQKKQALAGATGVRVSIKNQDLAKIDPLVPPGAIVVRTNRIAASAASGRSVLEPRPRLRPTRGVK